VAKIRRTGGAPEWNALRSRGCPDPDRAIGRPKSRKQLREELASKRTTDRLAAAQSDMLRAQKRVRELKASGMPYERAASEARLARARYLALDGARVQGNPVQVADHSERWT
jgi:hypothetical protein